jgi:tape measure domain-containing protein
VFAFAEAFVQFGVAPGSLEGVLGRAKEMLKKLSKESTSFDFSKGLGAGVKKMAGEAKNHLGNLGTLTGEMFSSIKGGGGVVKSITAAFSLAGPEIAGLLMNPITGGIVAGVGMALATLPGAIERETKLTKLGIQTGSPDRGKALASGMRSTFTGTGLNAPEAAASEMAAKGMSPAEITAQMKVLGNISVATGESMEGMAEALAKTEASGKVTGRTLQAMRPVAEELAREYGVSTERIFAMAEDGTIKVNQLKDAMQALGGETGRWGNALATMQDTTAGRWSQLTTEIAGLFADVGTTIMDAFDLKDLFADFTMIIEFVRKIWNLVFDVIPIGKAIGLVFWSVWKVFEGIFWVVNKIVDAITEMVKWAEYLLTLGFYDPWKKDKAKTSGDKSLQTKKDMVGGNQSFGHAGIADLATTMQDNAGRLQVNLAQQQLAEQKTANKHLAVIAKTPPKEDEKAPSINQPTWQ